MFGRELLTTLERERIIAVVTIDRADDALPLADALLAGGVHAIELTLRTDAALEALSSIVSHRTEIVAGVGTVLRPDQCETVYEMGATFGVTPGLNPEVVKSARSQGLQFAPGIATPSELERAVSLGCNVLKFFPSEPQGGLKYLTSMNTPYAHLGLKFIPLGGVNESNLAEYLSADMVLAVGGSWIANRNLIQQGAWDEIRNNSLRARQIVKRMGGRR